MNVDGSVAPAEFKLAPPADEIWNVARMILFVQDSGSFDAELWGNGITMVNGIEFIVREKGVPSVLRGEIVRTTGELASIMHDVNHHSFGIGDEFITARLTFTKYGNPIILDGSFGDKISVFINDDLTGLTVQNATFQGYVL